MNACATHAVYKQQQRVARAQEALVTEGVFDDATHTLTGDHVFDNWTRAAHAISGMATTWSNRLRFPAPGRRRVRSRTP